MSGVTAATPANGLQGHEDAAYAAYLRERQLERLGPYLADAWRAGREMERARRPACVTCARTDTEVLLDAGFTLETCSGIGARLLLALLRREGRWVPTADLFLAGWGAAASLSPAEDGRLVRVRVSLLRRLIELRGWCIDSAQQIGFRLHRAGAAWCLWDDRPRPRGNYRAHSGCPVSPDDMRAIRALASEGMSPYALGRRFHRDTKTIRAIVRREGRYADDATADGGAG